MKRKTVSIVSLLLALFFSLFAFACGQPNELSNGQSNELSNGQSKTVVSVATMQEKLIALYCEERDGDDMLITAMDDLKVAGKLQFEIVGGMVSSIGGLENAADYSACWMLYTTDEELSNSEWGVVEYNGQCLGSAIVGAESLPLKAGEYYVWSYQTF